MGNLIMNVFKLYGAHFFQKGENAINKSRKGDLYHYVTYVGEHTFDIDDQDSVILLSDDKSNMEWRTGIGKVSSKHMAVVLRGYTCGNKITSLGENVNLPYINGCATKQIFHAERVGDPTVQQLTIPPYTSEQAHHIHPTARVVYVEKGSGYSIVGQGDLSDEIPLTEGMVCVLDPMSPHHFRTEGDHLTVLPVHIFSSAKSDHDHPMFNGTKEV